VLLVFATGGLRQSLPPLFCKVTALCCILSELVPHQIPHSYKHFYYLIAGANFSQLILVRSLIEEEQFLTFQLIRTSKQRVANELLLAEESSGK
jgi:hypothetical protein